MRGSEAKALNELSHLSNADIQSEAAKLVSTIKGHSRSTSVRIRRLLAEARSRQLPIALMPKSEQEKLQESKAIAAQYNIELEEKMRRESAEQRAAEFRATQAWESRGFGRTSAW